ncbi:MAG TPA: hypothetical protein VIF57_16940, partial [Polyangia bacterium]
MRRAGHTRIRLAAIALSALAAAVVALPSTASARVHGLQLGFTDNADFQFQPDPTQRAIAFQHAKAAGTELIRVSADWDNVAPTAPPNIATSANPDWAGYNWTSTDTAVRETVAGGFTPVFITTEAPRWAEGPNRPSESVA